MCPDHTSDAGPSNEKDRSSKYPDLGEYSPLDWETIELPPDHVLSHLTDAHCHPTDLNWEQATYDKVQLGGLASMSTVPEDQEKVKSLSSQRPWLASSQASSSSLKGPSVVACFGYHPWFSHRYTLLDEPPSKEAHYSSLFFKPELITPPSNKRGELLKTLLPYLPEPIPFGPLLKKVKDDAQASLEAGRLTMIGEIGLDGGARMRWPKEARHLHPESICCSVAEPGSDGSKLNKQDGQEALMEEEQEEVEKAADEKEEEEEEDWKRLTPFRTSMAHQTALVEAQMEVAIELGINVSFHSVAAAGPTLDLLKRMRDKHRTRFTNRINVDVHSGGGFSAEFWRDTERNLRNVYASPSIFITARSPSAPELIKAISKDRMLVESDSHDVTISTRAVWTAIEWISRCKGWRLEGRDNQEWTIDSDRGDDEEAGRGKGKDESDVWTTQTLEKNWATFMGLIEE